MTTRDFTYFILGLLLGVPAIIFGVNYLADNVTAMAVAALMGLVFAIVLCLVVIWKRDAILAFAFGPVRIELDRLADAANNAAQHFASGQVKNGIDELRILIQSVAARYVWIAARRWMLATLVGILAVFAGLVGTALVFKQNQLIDRQNRTLEDQSLKLDLQNEKLETQNQLLDSQNHLAEASRRASLLVEFNDILNEIDEELDQQEQLRSWWGLKPRAGPAYLEDAVDISDRLAARIVALSRSLRPYRYLIPETGTLTDRDRPLSPERGQLLYSLAVSRIDLTNIRVRGGDFSRSDLRNANLIGTDLSNLRLSHSDFSLANLSAVDFSHTDLRNASLVGANLSGSILNESQLEGADLTHVDLRDLQTNEGWNISIGELKKAKNWQLALYDDRFAVEFLGLTSEDMEKNSLARDEFFEATGRRDLSANP